MIKKTKFTSKERHKDNLKQKDYQNKTKSPPKNNHISAIRTDNIKPQRPVKQVYREEKERVTEKTLQEMIQILRTSVNLGTFYQRWVQEHDDKILVALGLITEEMREQLEYLDKHRLIDLANSTSESETFNHDYYKKLKTETQQDLSEIPLESINEHEHSSLYNYPYIYLLGDLFEKQRLLEWSLPFNVKSIYQKSDYDSFIKAEGQKRIIIIAKKMNNVFKDVSNHRSDLMLKLNAYIKSKGIPKIFLDMNKSDNNNKYYLNSPTREKLLRLIRKIERNG